MENLRALKIALFHALSSDAGVSALVDSRVFDTKVPDGTEAPWVRYYVAAAAEQQAFSPAEPLGTRFIVTVDAVSTAEVGAEAEDTLEAIEHVLEGAELAESGWVFVFRRQSKRKLFDPDARAWVLSVDFLAFARKA